MCFESKIFKVMAVKVAACCNLKLEVYQLNLCQCNSFLILAVCCVGYSHDVSERQGKFVNQLCAIKYSLFHSCRTFIKKVSFSSCTCPSVCAEQICVHNSKEMM